MTDDTSFRLGSAQGERTINQRGDHALESDIPEGSEYAGSSICMIPIRCTSATLQEANERLDVAIEAIRVALEQLPDTEMATSPDRVPEVLEALEVTTTLYSSIAAAQVRRAHDQARNN